MNSFCSKLSDTQRAGLTKTPTGDELRKMLRATAKDVGFPIAQLFPKRGGHLRSHLHDVTFLPGTFFFEDKSEAKVQGPFDISQRLASYELDLNPHLQVQNLRPRAGPGGRRIHKKHGRRPQANHQGRLQGSPHRFWQHCADAAAGPGARPQHLQKKVKAFLDRVAAERLQQLRASGAHEPAAGGPGRHEGLRGQVIPLHAGGHRRAHQVPRSR